MASNGSHSNDVDGPPLRGTVSEIRPLHWRGQGTLLVVDDDPGVREVMASLLAWCGFTVLTAADGQSALTIFRRCQAQIRLVLVDLALPDTDGDTLFQTMRRIRPGLPGILCSGSLADDTEEPRFASDWAAVIRKPFRLTPFLQKVRTVLEG